MYRFLSSNIGQRYLQTDWSLERTKCKGNEGRTNASDPYFVHYNNNRKPHLQQYYLRDANGYDRNARTATLKLKLANKIYQQRKLMLISENPIKYT